MASKQIEHKQELVRLANVIRSKYDAFKRGELDYHSKLERPFRPLLESQNKYERKAPLVKLKNDDSGDTEYPPSSTVMPCDDFTYGLKFINGRFYIGNFPVSFTPHTIKIDNKEYERTDGLLSLLSSKNPKEYTPEDVQNYKKILESTEAHLTKNKKMKWSRSPKYDLIRELFAGDILNLTAKMKDKPLHSGTPIPNQSADEDWQDSISYPELPPSSPDEIEEISGRGMPVKVIKANSRQSKVQYVYYDDVNELIQRLYLLHISEKAGNSNVRNEIVNIELELKELNII